MPIMTGSDCVPMVFYVFIVCVALQHCDQDDQACDDRNERHDPYGGSHFPVVLVSDHLQEGVLLQEIYLAGQNRCELVLALKPVQKPGGDIEISPRRRERIDCGTVQDPGREFLSRHA
jgi:hypothetical protein